MKTILFYTLLALLPSVATAAESPGIKVVDSSARRTGNLLDLNVLLDCSNLGISSNEQLAVQPVLIGKNDTLRLPAILFTGNTRD